jgi:hypothetical protein
MDLSSRKTGQLLSLEGLLPLQFMPNGWLGQSASPWQLSPQSSTNEIQGISLLDMLKLLATEAAHRNLDVRI